MVCVCVFIGVGEDVFELEMCVFGLFGCIISVGEYVVWYV